MRASKLASLVCLGVASMTFLSGVAQANYSHRWASHTQYGNTYVGVGITNTSNVRISCNVSVVVQRCWGSGCRTTTEGGHTGIIFPGREYISGWYAGSGVRYNTRCRRLD